MAAADLVELWRGGVLESTHRGHVVICDDTGQITESWGDPRRLIFPRSSCKMLQALPMVESGAFDAAGLTEAHLALSCASHQGEPIHTDMVRNWLRDLGLGESDLRCGAHVPYSDDARDALILAHAQPCQLHNNCSGKHSGFLTANKHIKGHSEYVELDHPVQRAVLAATEEVTGETSAGHGIDGCSAPNFLTSISGLARAMARFAAASDAGDSRQKAMVRIRDAMRRYPQLVAGTGQVGTELTPAMNGRVALKVGAEGTFVGIVPELKLGFAIKIDDGSPRARDAAAVAVLTHLGMLDAAHPMAQKRLSAPQLNCRGFAAAELRLAPGFTWDIN